MRFTVIVKRQHTQLANVHVHWVLLLYYYVHIIDLSMSEIVPINDNFSPFSSIAEAFLFILLHSPRPIVSYINNRHIHDYLYYYFLYKGENNVGFIIYMLSRLLPGVRIPSLKKFKLPGYIAPSRVCYKLHLYNNCSTVYFT